MALQSAPRTPKGSALAVCGSLVFILLVAISCAAAAPALSPTPRADWRIDLVAEAPEIGHPSVVCAAPDGRVFVAEDPMDITLPAQTNAGRILCFHLDGRRTVFADHLYAVFGMQYLEGKLYVLHNPKLSVFADEKGVGSNRVELIESTQPNPWALDWNDHVPANFKLAMDGYFYVAVGDKGIYGAIGRDGKRVDLHGGGILRLRPDGTELEIYCTGVRNILDVALNCEDEMFTYDNTDEHDWMGRLTHMVDGGFYGYPYDFVPRRPYTLWMMHDFGGGAATGVFAYNEDALPEEYHGNLFLADFGKRQLLRVKISRDGATYGVDSYEEMFSNPPEDFRPVGISLGADGSSIYICDWQHRDTKEQADVGRLWKLSFTGPTHGRAKPSWYLAAAMGQPFRASTAELLEGLSHPSREVRVTAQRRLAERKETNGMIKLLGDRAAPSYARSHAIWALDAIDRAESGRKSIIQLVNDPDPIVCRQAIRQLGLRRRTEALRGLLPKLNDPDASIRFETATALGRIADERAVTALTASVGDRDLFARFAGFTAINRIGKARPQAWPAIVQGLRSDDSSIREGTEFAVRETYDKALLDVLAAAAEGRHGAAERWPTESRQTALRVVAGLHHKLPEWTGEWWAYHPALAAPPLKNVAWKGTPEVLAVLRNSFRAAEPSLRRTAVEAVQVARDTNSAPALREQFERETDANVRDKIVEVLGEFRDEEFAPRLAVFMREHSATETIRSPIRAAGQIGGRAVISALIDLLGSSSIYVQTEACGALGELKASNAIPKLAPLAMDHDRPRRSAAQTAIARIGGAAAIEALQRLLTNASVEIRREGVNAIGELRDKRAIPDLLVAWNSPETRTNAISSLAKVSDLRALDAYLDGLSLPDSALREQCRKALTPLRDAALPLIEARASQLQSQVLTELRRVYANHASAKASSLFVSGPELREAADYEKHALEHSGNALRGQRLFFDEASVACIRCHAVAGHGGTVGPELTLIGAQFPRATLIEDVLYPSKVVREGYQQVLVQTRDGETTSGLIKAETADAVIMVTSDARVQSIPKGTILSRIMSKLSLMPEGLHLGLTLEQFADLIAFLESRRVDPRSARLEPPPSGFIALLEWNDLRLWNVDNKVAPHWAVKDGVLEHDGVAEHLWTRDSFADFVLRLEWRWPDPPKWEDFPVISRDGVEVQNSDGKVVTEHVLDAGDSGVFVRGFPKAQANLFCYPVGSGEIWDYRTDPTMNPAQRRAFTPATQADNPLGDWNRIEITMRGDRMSVVLNGAEVISKAEVPGLPERGPIGLQHEHGRIQFRNIFIKNLK